MAVIIDTNIAIGLRDVDPGTMVRVLSLTSLPLLSSVSRVELEDGVSQGPETAEHRRELLDALLHRLKVLPFGRVEAEHYRSIIATCGYARRRTIDRMIAATALAHGATLVTANGKDFRDIPGLQLEEW